jgi:hypothetical protein
MAVKKWAFYLQKAVEPGKLLEAKAHCMRGAALKPTELSQERVRHSGQLPGQLPCRGHSLPPLPKLILAVPRLIEDVKALKTLFNMKLPSQALPCSAQVYTILYEFADASDSGFGRTVLVEGRICYGIGTLGSDSDKESSNYREFENVVDSLRAKAAAGNSLVFLCTDNSMVEAALHKETHQAKSCFHSHWM